MTQKSMLISAYFLFFCCRHLLEPHALHLLWHHCCESFLTFSVLTTGLFLWPWPISNAMVTALADAGVSQAFVSFVLFLRHTHIVWGLHLIHLIGVRSQLSICFLCFFFSWSTFEHCAACPPPPPPTQTKPNPWSAVITVYQLNWRISIRITYSSPSALCENSGVATAWWVHLCPGYFHMYHKDSFSSWCTGWRDWWLSCVVSSSPVAGLFPHVP